jgi:hypothetical protein
VQPIERRSCRPDDAALDLARSPGCDQLAAERAEQCLSNRCAAKRPQPAERANRLSQERITREPFDELRVVVVEAERETHPLDRLFTRSLNEQDAVRLLSRGGDLEPAAYLVHRPEATACRDTRRVAAVPDR